MSPRKIVITAMGLIIAFAAVTVAVFPLQTRMAMRRFELYFKGVSEFHAGPYTGFEKDLCDAQDPEARGCTCVLMLHGLGDDATSWSRLLNLSKKAWTKPLRIYAPEIERNRAFKSGDNPENYRVRVQARDLARAFAPLCPSWVLVGNSLGGAEALWIALDGDLKVEKLVLIDAAGTRASVSALLVKLFSEPTAASMRDFFSRIYYKPPMFTEPMLARAAEIFKEERLGDIVHAQNPEEDAVDGRLSSLRVPTMLLWGAGDRLIPDTVGKEMHAEIPSSIWREIPECGHLPQKECPVPVVQAIDEMLQMGRM